MTTEQMAIERMSAAIFFLIVMIVAILFRLWRLSVKGPDDATALKSKQKKVIAWVLFVGAGYIFLVYGWDSLSIAPILVMLAFLSWRNYKPASSGPKEKWFTRIRNRYNTLRERLKRKPKPPEPQAPATEAQTQNVPPQATTAVA